MECNTENAMETQQDGVYVINIKSFELACVFRDLWSLVMF